MFSNETDTGSVMLSRQLRHDDDAAVNQDRYNEAMTGLEQIALCKQKVIALIEATARQLNFEPVSDAEWESSKQAVLDYMDDCFYPYIETMRRETGNEDLGT
jgi:hypothetical protein